MRNSPSPDVRDGASPPSGRGPLDCGAVRRWLQAGPHGPLSEALQDLAEHLDDCESCSDLFGAVSQNDFRAVGGPDSPLAALPRTGRLLTSLIQDVLDEYDRRQPPKPLVVQHTRLPGPEWTAAGDYDWQLVRGQVLAGKSHQYEVVEPMGCGDFTETYAAEQLLEKSGDEQIRRRVVIKLPRVADEMSPEAAVIRLDLLQKLIQVQAQRLQNLSGLRSVAQMIDCGQYGHRLHNESTESTFVAYEFIDGQDLAAYMAAHYPAAERFRGLPTIGAFADWARKLTKGLLEIHNHLVEHGDVCPRNILVTAGGQPVYVDVGQSLFREVLNGANAFRGAFYRAPEGIGTPSSDLFSLGGLLFFLATGREPIGLTYADREALKQQIALQVKEANPNLYQEDIGVADTIAMCLRKEGRVQHASRLLDQIDTFWPETSPGSILDELKSITDPAERLDAGGNSMYLAVAGAHIRSLARTLTDMSKGVFDVSGSVSEIRSAACQLLRALRTGDAFLTVSVPPFWFPDNMGINGQFLTMCRNAAARGAFVKRVLLIDENRSDPYLQEIVAAQLNAAAELDPARRSNFVVRYVLIGAESRRKLVAKGRHFGLLVKGGDRIAMFPAYDAENRLVTLHFRSGPRQVEGLRAVFEDLESRSKPLIDLQLPDTRLGNLNALEALDGIEKAG